MILFVTGSLPSRRSERARVQTNRLLLKNKPRDSNDAATTHITTIAVATTSNSNVAFGMAASNYIMLGDSLTFNFGARVPHSVRNNCS